jgi:hypothetical protein
MPCHAWAPHGRRLRYASHASGPAWTLRNVPAPDVWTPHGRHLAQPAMLWPHGLRVPGAGHAWAMDAAHSSALQLMHGPTPDAVVSQRQPCMGPHGPACRAQRRP